ncbi:MAG: CDP-alcohol phosphatidyltransferase family protein [Caldilineales bacterium]|nr:CDP-alcohol phosphatidyltransferase family protein [Caldilineales bacterium]
MSPNAVTLLALVIGLSAAALATRQMVALALALWLLNRILDGLDGMLARATDQRTDFGGYLDIVTDFIVYAALPIGLFLGRATAGLGVSLALLLGSFYVNAASWMYLSAILEKRRAGASARGELTTVTMPAGLVGGTETILFYSAFLIWPGALRWLFPTMAALVMMGVCQRLWWARRHLFTPQIPQAKRPAGEFVVRAVVESAMEEAPV